MLLDYRVKRVILALLEAREYKDLRVLREYRDPRELKVTLVLKAQRV